MAAPDTELGTEEPLDQPTSLDQTETSLTGEGGSQSQLSGIKGKVAKSKTKWIIGGVVGGGGLIGIAIIIFFLLLFKNIHIKELFLDYEFAKFNRAFRNRLEQAVDDPQANPKGNADSTIIPSDSPETALSDIDPAKLKNIKADTSSMDETVRLAENLDQSSAGSIGAVDSELGINSSIADESGKSDDQVAKDTTTAVQDDINQGLSSGQSPPTEAVKDAVDDTNKVADTAATTAELQDTAIQGFSRGLNSAVSKLSGPFVIATLGCIARDIFSAPGHIITKIRFQGLARSSATLNKYADCQKQSKCSLSQIATVAQKFDNSTGSFTQSCAYLRAAGRVGNDCTQSDPNYSVIPPPGSIPDQLVRLSDALDGKINLGPLSLNVPIGKACSVILQPGFQIAFAAINVTASGVAAVTGVADFGASDVALAAGQGAALVFASKIGKALALQAALYYGGGLFHRNFSGPDWGNLVGGGDKALATSACAINGCRRLSASENAQLALAIHADDAKAAQQQGLAYRLFSPHNPTSTLGLLADRMPSSPQTAVAAIGNFFATMMSPAKAGKSLAALINPVQPAWAADITSNTYGIPDYGFTDAELNQWGVVENSRWVQANVSAQQRADFDKCFDPKQTPAVDLITGDGNGQHCTDLASSNDIFFKHYRIYKLDQRVTQDLVLLYNNQDTTGGGYAAGSSSTAGCVNPFTNPAWGLARTDQGVDYDPPNGQPLPVFAPCDGYITSTNGPGWPGGVYINFKLTSGPFIGKCIYIAEHLTDVPTPDPNKIYKAGDKIATALPGSPWTEWGWSAGAASVSTPYPPGTPPDKHYPTEGGKAFARFIKSLGGPVRDDPGPGPLYPATGRSC